LHTNIFEVIGICKRLHDSMSAYSPESEIEEVSFLIQSSLDRFNLNADPEQALAYLVSCRAALMNIDRCQKVEHDWKSKLFSNPHKTT
jgi:hypothetical protein